ncbi:hypothetical protein FRC03_011785 [Tulasnella sp. 419]|nr:hypothetical protein FRC03_011785 [Tulasnella sp. 419]
MRYLTLSDPNSVLETIVAFCEFLEVAIHTILYLRGIYPAELFARRRKYDAPVFQARHPGLNEYIAGSVKSIGQELASGGVKKVVVVIKDMNDVALERFVFAIQSMLDVDAQNRDVPILDSASRTSLHQHFRSILVKLTSQVSLLRDFSGEGIILLADFK